MQNHDPDRTRCPGSLLRLVAALAALLACTGCYLAADGKDLDYRLTALEARYAEFLASYEADRVRLTSLAERAEANILSLQSALDEAQSFLQRNNADLGARVGDIEREINGLRGRLEEAQHLFTRLTEELNLLRTELQEVANSGGRR
jgi:chromosome segregation ATPase